MSKLSEIKVNIEYEDWFDKLLETLPGFYKELVINGMDEDLACTLMKNTINDAVDSQNIVQSISYKYEKWKRKDVNSTEVRNELFFFLTIDCGFNSKEACKLIENKRTIVHVNQLFELMKNKNYEWIREGLENE